MINLIHYGRHTVTHKSIIGAPEVPPVRSKSYQGLIAQRSFEPGTYIFTDRERMDAWELRIYSALCRHLQSAGPGFRVINAPGLMMDRATLLRSLYKAGLNSFNAYPVTERCMPDRYPVFIRRQFDHYQPLSALLKNEAELVEALAVLRHQGEPEYGLLITEFCGEPAEGDLYRKFSSYRIGAEVFFHSTVHERSWLVKYGSLNSGNDRLYEEEQRMIRENAYKDELTRAFDLAGIEYGRADFGVVGGKVQIYEINTNPTISRPKPHPQCQSGSGLGALLCCLERS